MAGVLDAQIAGRKPDAKFAVFRCMADADPRHYVRGQYDGYLDIDGVAAESPTETYAALRLEIDNWRWAGVPFLIRTGKRLPRHPDRLDGDSTPFTRQDGVEEAWRVMAPLLDAPPPVHPYAPGSWGPAEADRVVAGVGRWHDPWVTS